MGRCWTQCQRTPVQYSAEGARAVRKEWASLSPRWEPCALAARARVCAGGSAQPLSLPRPADWQIGSRIAMPVSFTAMPPCRADPLVRAGPPWTRSSPSQISPVRSLRGRPGVGRGPGGICLPASPRSASQAQPRVSSAMPGIPAEKASSAPAQKRHPPCFFL